MSQNLSSVESDCFTWPNSAMNTTAPPLSPSPPTPAPAPSVALPNPTPAEPDARTRPLALELPNWNAGTPATMKHNQSKFLSTIVDVGRLDYLGLGVEDGRTTTELKLR